MPIMKEKIVNYLRSFKIYDLWLIMMAIEIAVIFLSDNTVVMMQSGLVVFMCIIYRLELKSKASKL